MTADRYLVVKGWAGIGNRLLEVADGIRSAKSFDRRLVVDWNDTNYSGKGDANAFPRFLQLVGVDQGPESSWLIPDQDQLSFEPEMWRNNLDKSPEQVSRRHRWTVDGPFRGRGLKRRLKKDVAADICVVCGGLGGLRTRRGLRGSGLAQSPVSICRPADLREHAPRYYGRYQNLRTAIRNHLKCRDELDSQVHSYAAQQFANRPVVGVHVRHTAPVKRNRDLSGLLGAIDAVLERETSALLFLATDAVTVSETFRDRYGDRLLTTNKWFSSLSDGDRRESNSLHQRQRQLPECHPAPERILEEALLDMMLLARTDYLFGQINSTFSTIASMYFEGDDEHLFFWGRPRSRRP